MIQILLIRSGATDYDAQGRIQGTLGIPLSEDGRRQAALAAADLAAQPFEIEALYAGPCQSVQETAQVIAERLDLKPKKLKTLGNLDYGLWQGLLLDDVKQKHPRVFKQWEEHPDTVCPPEGESVAEAKLRLRKVLDKLVKRHKDGVVALVLAPTLARILRAMLQDQPIMSVCRPVCSIERLWDLMDLPTPAPA